MVGAVTLTAVQNAIVRWIGPGTVLVGHGLENDLRALRLVHTCIADSALLFPHPHGLPKRRGLKDLAKDHLGLSIQTGGAEGHSSAEDARVALNLIKWKYAGEPETSPFRPVRRATLPGPRPFAQHAHANSNSGSPPHAPGSPPRGRDNGSSTQGSPMHSPAQSASAGFPRAPVDATGAAARAAAKTAANRAAAAEERAAKIAMAEELAAEQAAVAEAAMQAKAEAAIKAKAAAKAQRREARRKAEEKAAKKEAKIQAAAEKEAKKKAAEEAKAARAEAGLSASPEPAASPQVSALGSPSPSSPELELEPEPEHEHEHEPEPAGVKANVVKRLRLIPEVLIDIRLPRRKR